AAGAAFSLAATHTGLWWLPFLCTGFLAWRVAGSHPRQAALLGWSFGSGWLGAATWWLYISLHDYGALPAPLTVAAVAALCMALSAYLALAMALFARLQQPQSPAASALLFGALWLAAELARAVIFTGFPWAATGYGQVDGPLAALAPWVGVFGIGFAVAVLAAASALGLARRSQHWGVRGAPLLVSVALLIGAPLVAHDFSTPAGRLDVSLLQTNVAQDEKFATERLPLALAQLESALQAARGPLVVAPETAIPLLPEQLEPAAWTRLTAPFRGPDKAALIGLPLGSYEAGYTNSVAGLSAATAALPAGFYRYDKQHLVPFGEFIPPGFRWFVAMMNMPLGDFARGPLAAPSFAFGGQRIAPNICYEDLFGEELALRFTNPTTAPTVLANVSNIAWFGDSIAITQHLHISRLRTLELQRPMLRATNTGATAVIDHRGQVTAALPSFTRATLDASVEGRNGLTPFARWAGRWGLAPALVLCLAIVALAGRWRGAP
ncbi:MAG: apolipoprotein N-acyltransferase, partial [Burkholderiaceae bacterium]